MCPLLGYAAFVIIPVHWCYKIVYFFLTEIGVSVTRTRPNCFSCVPRVLIFTARFIPVSPPLRCAAARQRLRVVLPQDHIVPVAVNGIHLSTLFAFPLFDKFLSSAMLCVGEDDTVLEVKQRVAEAENLPRDVVNSMTLTYHDHLLHDSDTLAHCGVSDGADLYAVASCLLCFSQHHS